MFESREPLSLVSIHMVTTESDYQRLFRDAFSFQRFFQIEIGRVTERSRANNSLVIDRRSVYIELHRFRSHVRSDRAVVIDQAGLAPPQNRTPN